MIVIYCSCNRIIKLLGITRARPARRTSLAELTKGIINRLDSSVPAQYVSKFSLRCAAPAGTTPVLLDRFGVIR